jgi:Thioredoxin-like
MQLWPVLALALVAACTKGSPSRHVADGVDEAYFALWVDAMAHQVAKDAHDAKTRKFASVEEAQVFVSTLTLSGLHPRPEFFGRFADAGDLDKLARKMSDFASTNQEVAGREVSLHRPMMEPPMKELLDSINTQFPSGDTPPRDPATALAEARIKQRPTFMVFCSAKASSCDELARTTLSDPWLQQTLDRDFVSAFIDMTDDSDPKVQARRADYRIKQLPTILLFDAAGQEVARITDLVDAGQLEGLLAEVH